MEKHSIDDMAMKKISLFFVLAAFVSLVACNKEVPAVDNTIGENGKMKTEVIGAKSDANDSKATVAYGTGVFAWDNTDCVAFYVSGGGVNSYVKSSAASSISGGSASFSVSYADGGTRDNYAIYPYYLVIDKDADTGNLTDATNKVVLPSSYTLAEVSGTKTPCPMIAVNTGSSWYFRQLCALLNLTINGIPADTYKLTVKFNGNNVCGEFTVSNPSSENPSISSTPFYSSDRASAYDVITITSESAITTGSVVVNIPLPVGTYSDISVMAYDDEGNGTIAFVGTLRESQPNPTQAMARKQVGPRVITLNNTKFFTIEDGKYGLIAPGNLQAVIGSYTAPLATATTWRFAAHQYDYLIDTDWNGYGPGIEGSPVLANQFITYNTPGTVVDLFRWQGNSITTPGNFSYGLCSAAYDAAYYGNLSTWEPLRHDWGENTITYGGVTYVPGTWHTPRNDYSPTKQSATSLGDWPWILYRRTDARNKQGYAIVEAVHGVILLPDNFTDPMKNNGSGAFVISAKTTEDDYSSNKYNGSDWAAMESAGAVFLPAEGLYTRINGSDVGQGFKFWRLGTRGFYWAANGIDSSTQAARIAFNTVSNTVSVLSSGYRDEAMPVRLIRDLN